MDVYTVNVRLSFTAHSAEQARDAAMATLRDLADDFEAPTRDPDDAPEWLSWFVADAVDSGAEV